MHISMLLCNTIIHFLKHWPKLNMSKHLCKNFQLTVSTVFFQMYNIYHSFDVKHTIPYLLTISTNYTMLQAASYRKKSVRLYISLSIIMNDVYYVQNVSYIASYFQPIRISKGNIFSSC